jgi:hypothetical protein
MNKAPKVLSIVGGKTNMKTAAALKSVAKSIKNSNELQSRKSRNRLSSVIYKQLQTKQKEKLKNFASRYYASVPRKQNGTYWNITMNNKNRTDLKKENGKFVLNYLKSTKPKLYNKIRRGDLFINVAHPHAHSYGSRGHVHGIYIFNRKANNLILRPLNHSVDRGFGYGGIPGNFKVITEFPNPNYWAKIESNFDRSKNKKFSTIPNRNLPSFNWYHYNVTIPIKDLKKSIKYNNNNGIFTVNHFGIKYKVNASEFYTTNELKKLNSVFVNQMLNSVKVLN